MNSGNSEDPSDKADRLRQRRVSLLGRRQAAEDNARGITQDLGAVYNLGSLFNFGKVGTAQPAKKKSASSASSTNVNMGNDRG